MPSWTHCLRAIVLLAIAGFGLVILSSHWLLLALLIAAAFIVLWFCRKAAPSTSSQPQKRKEHTPS